jgi:hypothetical protein
MRVTRALVLAASALGPRLGIVWKSTMRPQEGRGRREPESDAKPARPRHVLPQSKHEQRIAR